jgi:hypothetical protein
MKASKMLFTFTGGDTHSTDIKTCLFYYWNAVVDMINACHNPKIRKDAHQQRCTPAKMHTT